MKNSELNNELKDIGYNIIAYPNSGVKIYNLLLDNRSPAKTFTDTLLKKSKPVVYIGELTDIFTNTTSSLSKEHNTVEGSDFSNKSSGLIEINAGISYINKLVKELGGKIKAAFSFGEASKVSFGFSNVIRSFQTINTLSDYINSGKCREVHQNFNDLKGGNVYVVYELLSTNSFFAEFYNKTNDKILIEVETLKKVIESNLEIKNEHQYESKISFEGEIPVIFGFKAAKIKYIDSLYALSAKKFSSLQDIGIDEISIAKLYPIIDKEYKTLEEFVAVLPGELSDNKKQGLVEYCKYEKFKLDPTDNLQYLDGEFKIENMESDFQFVNIDFSKANNLE